MRLACFEAEGVYRRQPDGSLEPDWDAIGDLWERFNDWRVRVRPALGRIDIAALGLTNSETRSLRVAVPIRSDYRPPEPAKTLLFPGGSFAYCYADNVDEIDEAGAIAARWVEEQGLRRASDLIEVYKFHYNQDQHPCDCGFLVLNGNGADPLPPPASHANPLPIAR